MRKKLRDSRGLTLVEMLCATVILVLLCLMVNSGLHMAMTNYRAITSESEAQLLLSSLSNALADKLRYCVVYTDETGAAVTGRSIGEVTAPDGMVLVGGSKLLPDGAYGEETAGGGNERPYQAQAPEITSTVDSSTATFQIKLTVKDVRLDITKTTELTVRCLNPVKKEGSP